MVCYLALCPDDVKQDPVVYVIEFGEVFLAEGPRTASIQEGLECLGLYHSGLEGERYFRLVGQVCMYVRIYEYIIWSELLNFHLSMDQPGMVANPTRGQLNRKNYIFSVPVRA